MHLLHLIRNGNAKSKALSKQLTFWYFVILLKR